jgi:glycine oxidase
MARTVDLIIVGQGIAGSCLAWWCHQAGLSFLVLDEGLADTSSGISAGMMTPITGKKLVLAQEFVDFWEPCKTFYRAIETHFGEKFLHKLPMLRILANEEEQRIYKARRSPVFDHYARVPEPSLVDPLILHPHGVFEMPNAGRLDMALFCQRLRAALIEWNSWEQVTVSWAEDFLVSHDEVLWMPGDVHAQGVIFCDGASYQISAFFPEYQLTPSKGEILTLNIPDLTEQRIVHQHLWIMPLGHGLVRCGATYEWDDLSSNPTEAGKQAILSQLKTWLTADVTVVDHVAAVRPTPRQFRPFAGWSTLQPRLGMINGLGSKGSLIAPCLTETFLRNWCGRRANS